MWNRLFIGFAFSGIAVLCSPALFSAETTAVVKADELLLDLEGELQTYRGNVVFRWGDVHLECDELMTSFEKDKIQTGKCTGSPATFKRCSETTKAHGWAGSILYDAIAQTVMFEGDANLYWDRWEAHGKQIVFGLDDKKVKLAEAFVNLSVDAENAPHKIIEACSELTILPKTE